MWQEILQGSGGGKTLENITLGDQLLVDSNLPVTVGKYYIIHAWYNGANDITPTGCQVLSQSTFASYQGGLFGGRILFVKATATIINIQDRYISASEINL